MPADARRGGDTRTLAYIAVVWLVTAVAVALYVPQPGTFLSLEPVPGLAALALVSWWMGSRTVDSRVRLAVSHIVVLSSVVMCGPLIATGFAAALAGFERITTRPRARIFNVAMAALASLAASAAFAAAGGVHVLGHLSTPRELFLTVALPLVAADVAQGVVNALLMAGVIRVSDGSSMRATVHRLLFGSGFTFFAYGVLSFLLVVLWQPAGLGWSSIVLFIAPLLGAWWALLQFGEEKEARSRALDVLVAATEAKAPHLRGHSVRVANLCAGMADELGLPAKEVTNIRTAGMLHDLGQVALHRSVVAGGETGEHRDEFETYPRRGADILRGVTFVADALNGIALHRTAPPAHAVVMESEPWLAAQIVQVADSFDLMVHGLRPGEPPRTVPEALAELARSEQSDRPKLVDALRRAVARQGRGADR